MSRHNAWLPVTVALVVLMLQAGGALAQDPPPAKAPVPPEEGDRGAARGPAHPDEAAAARRLRAEALRGQWQGVPRNQIQMLAVGDNIIILYGTYLCQFDGATLELKAKVDLREIIQADRRLLKELRGDRARKPARAEKGEKAQPAPAAEEQ